MTNARIGSVLDISRRQVSKSLNNKGSQPVIVRAFVKQLIGASQESQIDIPEGIKEKLVKFEKNGKKI